MDPNPYEVTELELLRIWGHPIRVVSFRAAERGLRGWALIHNFAPSCPETVRESAGLRSPAERLNGMQYHPEWLQNLLVSASLGGNRPSPQERDNQSISEVVRPPVGLTPVPERSSPRSRTPRMKYFSPTVLVLLALPSVVLRIVTISPASPVASVHAERTEV
jgi:hypothetical protein